MSQTPPPGLASLTIGLKLEDQPAWLDDEMYFMRNGDEIHVELMRQNGYRFCIARLTLDHFNHMVDLLLTP